MARRSSPFVTALLCLVIVQGTRCGPVTSTSASVASSSSSSSSLALQPRFLSKSQRFDVKIGDKVVLPCDVQNLDTYVIMWKMEDGPMLSASSVKISRDPRISVAGSSIEISAVEARDSGNYTCEINNAAKSRLTFELNVLEPAKVWRIPEEGHIRARKGKSVTMECRGEGNPAPSIRWSKPGHYFANGEDKIHGSAIHLQSVSRQDAGLYECLADNGVSEPAKATIELKVEYPPEIEIERNWIHSGVHQEAYLTCIVHAEPQANVMWYSDDSKIVPSDTRILESNKNKHTLILRRVEESDFGNYSCNAENELGRSSQLIQLSGKPSPAVFLSEPEGISADSYNLTWKIDSYAPIEEYKLMFRKLQYNETEDSNRAWKSAVIPTNHASTGAGRHLHHKHFYVFQNLEPASMYEAVVIGKNRYGYSDSSTPHQFHTQSSEYVPNAKNLEAKDAGLDIALTGASDAVKTSVVQRVLFTLATLVVLLI